MTKRKNVIIMVTTVAIIAVLVIIGIVKNTNTFIKGSDRSTTPAVSTSPQAQTPSVSTTPTTSTTPGGTPAVTEKYKSDTVKDFNITFNIPDDWKKISGYDNRYEGKSGFVEFTVLSGYGLSLKEAVDLQINDASKTFGEKPETKNITIDSQEATIIYSTDKASTAQCAVLVKFPKAVTISSTPYNYLLMWSDRGHIDTLAKDIKFIK